MTARAEYTDEEWALLVVSPWIVGLAVAVAEPGGVVREALAVASIESMVRDRYPGNELLASLWSTGKGAASAAVPPPVTPRDAAGPPLLERAVDTCRRVGALLAERSNVKEAQEFRRFLGDCAVAAAVATTTGGFLGMGGVRISPAERYALDVIHRELGFPPVLNEEGSPPPASGPQAAGGPPAPDRVRGSADVPSGPIDPS